MDIEVRGASENNLRDVDADFGDGLTVVTGVSGSGKSSLVFDTLYREVERRFVDVFGRPGEGMRLPPVRVRSVSGSGPAVAVGQNLLNRNPLSLVATASGLHPFLRLLYARFGERSCPDCGASLSVCSPDEVVETMAAHVHGCRVILPLLRGVAGSHRTLLEILVEHFGPAAVTADGSPLGSRRSLRPEHGHDIEIVLGSLSGRDAIASRRRRSRELLGRAVELGGNGVVLESRSARATLMLAAVCPRCGRAFRRLEPLHFHIHCISCGGRGCPDCAESAAVRWQGRSLPELLGSSVADFRSLLAVTLAPPGGERLFSEIRRRLEALHAVGLGYVGLDRPAPSLSRGEAQRLRLAVALCSRLEDMVHILDEPTVGQHPRDVASLVKLFRALQGPVVFVEHDRTAALLADRAIEIGPGAGGSGGRLVYSGTLPGLLRKPTHTGRAFSGRERVCDRVCDRVLRPTARATGAPAPELIRIRGAMARNLAGIDVDIPVGRLTVVTGVSGSGKSTLVEEVLVPSLRGRRPVGCERIEGPMLRPVAVDQSPIGVNPRSNPATYTGLADGLRRLFAEATGLSASQFSFNRPEGACPRCQGMGAVEVRMRYLPSTWVRCEECGGKRFRAEVLGSRVELRGRRLSIADILELPLADSAELLEGRVDAASKALMRALLDVGLGYLPLGQSSPSLSGGEAQRVKLSRFLGRRGLEKELLLLDEPSTGLHPRDLSGLLRVLDRLVRAGATVVVVEHNTDVVRAADWCVDLGPGAGPDGGRVVAQGDLASLISSRESSTGAALRAEERSFRRPASRPSRRLKRRAAIRITGARANNLRNVSLSIPKGKLCVVAGVSGSGKSSLVRDVLEAEARRRYLETLSLYERQGASEGSEAEVDAITGLGVTTFVSSQRWSFGLRMDVGWATEISRHLAVLYAARGTRWCPSCAVPMRPSRERLSWKCPRCAAVLGTLRPEHFSLATYAAACTKCHGVGSLQVPAPEKLIVHPDRPLCGGAMYSPGFFPQGYLCKPGNGGYDMVRALAARHGFDPCSTPWSGMTETARQAFLFGDPEPLEVTFRGKSGHVRTRTLPFGGFYRFVGDWDAGGTYTNASACPECGGSRLRPEYAAVRLLGRRIDELRQLPLRTLARLFAGGKLDEVPDATARSSVLTIRKRLGFLCGVGLGHVCLGRIASTLSSGEAQRVRLASLLGSGLTSLTILLDEPSRGLHPTEVGALVEVLERLRDEGNTVVVVEHDLELIRRADLLIDMGPGAGELGGRVVARGSPRELARRESPTGKWLALPRGERAPAARQRYERRHPTGELVIRRPRENNLDGEDVRIPLGILTGVCGVSGSGKSTLCIDTLARALQPVKFTTSVAREPLAPGRHDRIEGAPARTVVLDQVPRGVPSPYRFLGLDTAFPAIYARSPDAASLGLRAERLRRGCSACGGSGHQELDMGFLPAVRTVCEICGGTGMPAESRDLELRGLTLPALVGRSLAEVLELWADEPKVAQPLRAACSMGLGYLRLGQPGHTLSGGEVQRLRIARDLARGRPQPTLYILDEPTVGQHQDDVVRLVGLLRQLSEGGHSVLVVEHHPMVLAACDWLIELGPGGGPEGGHIVAQGTPEEIVRAATATSPYLRRALGGSGRG